ncbi:MAG: hypothetical protein NZ988_06230 [Thaumarchaeota archaeon]|nr:hypothetical protein [Candidatus Calditenuaceae archaeon]MDW8187620.1 hypothetical protein [Nitrososphaerota archaeon]
MTHRIEVNGRPYTVRLRARGWAHLQTLARALTETPPSDDRIDLAEKRVLELCVEPYPEGDEDLVLAKLMALYASLMREAAASFREEGDAGTGKGG